MMSVFSFFTNRLRMWLRKAILRRVNAGKRSAQRVVDNALEQAFHGGMFSMVMTSLIWIAIFMYVVFYYAYVPAPSYVRPVHFQIKPCEQSKNECVYPSAYVRLTRRQQLLMIGQQYKFFVQLEMPESPVNKELGMFMVCIQLKDKNGYLASQSCRSNMLHYRSDLLHQLKILFLSPLYILGNKEEKQVVTFELFSDFVEDQKHPVTDIYVEVQAQNVEIYTAGLQINAHLIGLRYLMYHWPVTSAIIGITFNLCVVFFTLSLSFYHNFFVDAIPLQIVRDHLRKLETRTDQFLKDHSILTGESSSGSAQEPSNEEQTEEKTEEEAKVEAETNTEQSEVSS